MLRGLGARGKVALLGFALGLSAVSCSDSSGDDDPSMTSNSTNSSSGGTSSNPAMPVPGDDPQSGDDVPGPTTVSTVMAPEIFQQLAGQYVGDLSGGAAITCGALLPVFDVMEDPGLAAVHCGYGGMHRVEVTDAGAVNFLDTTPPLQFVWDNRARVDPPSSTRLTGLVTYDTSDYMLTLIYPSAEDLTFSLLNLKFRGSDPQDLGEVAMPLARAD